MTALEALQQARLDTSKYARPRGWKKHRKAVCFIGDHLRKFRVRKTFDNKLRHDAMSPQFSYAELVNHDGSPVEWEVIEESEL